MYQRMPVDILFASEVSCVDTQCFLITFQYYCTVMIAGCIEMLTCFEHISRYSVIVILSKVIHIIGTVCLFAGSERFRLWDIINEPISVC